MATGSTGIQTGLRLPVFSYNDILDITTSDDPWRRKDVNDSCSHFYWVNGLRVFYRYVIIVLWLFCCVFFCPLTPLPHFSPFRISSWIIFVHDFPEREQ